MHGRADAFSKPGLPEALREGRLGRVAATFVQWSGADRPTPAVNWTAISDTETAQGFGRPLVDAVRPTQARPRSAGPSTIRWVCSRAAS